MNRIALRDASLRGAGRAAIALVTAGLLAGLMPAASVLAVVDTPTTTTVSWPANPVSAAAQSMDIEVTITPIPAEGGAVTLWWNHDGTPVAQYANSVSPLTGKGYLRLWNNAPLAVGTYEMSVAFTAGGSFLDSTSASHTVEIVLASNTVTLQAQANPVLAGANAGLTARSTGFTDSIQLWDAFEGAAPVLVDTKSSVPDGTGHYTASFTVVTPAVGAHVYTAATPANEVFAAGTSDPLSLEVIKIPTDPSWGALSQVKGGVPMSARFYVNRPGIGLASGSTGTATVKEGSTVLATCAVVDATCDFGMTLSTGLHTLTLDYGGDATFAASQRVEQVDVPADAVEATGVGVNLATFYPYKDGYKDTVLIRGTRAEPISAAIRIYGPTGKLVRTFSVASASGSYAVAWNGRTATGAALAAGRYKVVQTLNDGHSAKAFTSYATISMKRLRTYTKTLTKDYAHRSAQGTYSVAWDFSLPSATVYKKLVFWVYAKSSPSGAFGPHNFQLCGAGTFDLSCGSPAASISGSFAWRKVTGSASTNRSGRLVRLYGVAYVRSNLKSGRVTVTYAVLK